MDERLKGPACYQSAHAGAGADSGPLRWRCSNASFVARMRSVRAHGGEMPWPRPACFGCLQALVHSAGGSAVSSGFAKNSDAMVDRLLVGLFRVLRLQARGLSATCFAGPPLAHGAKVSTARDEDTLLAFPLLPLSLAPPWMLKLLALASLSL